MTVKSKYIDPFTDFGFKWIFGTEENKSLLISFLNDMRDLDTSMRSQAGAWEQGEYER